MRRIISVLAVAALMAAIMVVNVAPAFAALPWWKDGEKPNCTWGYHTNDIHPDVCGAWPTK